MMKALLSCCSLLTTCILGGFSKLLAGEGFLPSPCPAASDFCFLWSGSSNNCGWHGYCGVKYSLH